MHDSLFSDNVYDNKTGASLRIPLCIAGLLYMVSCALCFEVVAQPLMLNEQIESNEAILSDHVTIAPNRERLAYVKADIERTSCCIRPIGQELYTTALDGSGAIRIGDSSSPYGTLTPSLDWFVEFTPDSQYMLFGATESETGKGGLFRSTLDGSEIIKLAADVLTKTPDRFDITPDGKYAVFLQDGSADLWSVPISGGEASKLNSSGNVHFNYFLSPDSQFAIYYDLSKSLYSSRLDGTQSTKLDDDVNFLHFGPAPDSKNVVFTKGRFFVDSTVHTIPIEGGNSKLVHGTLPPGVAAQNWRFTPNDNELIFQANLSNEEDFGYYRVPVTGGIPSALFDPNVEQPLVYSFSGDGNHIVYEGSSNAPDGSGVYRLPLADGLPELISHPLTLGESISRFRWSPSDEWLTYNVATTDRVKTFAKRPESVDFIEITKDMPSWVNLGLLSFLENDEGVIYLADIEKAGRSEFFLTSLNTGERMQIGPKLGQQDEYELILLNYSDNRVLYGIGEDFFLDGLYLFRIPEPSCLLLYILGLLPISTSRSCLRCQVG